MAVVLPRVVDLLADRDAGERVHQLVRLVVIGAVLIVATCVPGGPDLSALRRPV